MRLWHEKLIPLLPRQQLLGQHRECCALRGKGWGKKHSTVEYIFKHSPLKLVQYHFKIIGEMLNRGYIVSDEWLIRKYRGKNCDKHTNESLHINHKPLSLDELQRKSTIYPEHNKEYLIECIENFRAKGVDVSEMEKLLKEA